MALRTERELQRMQIRYRTLTGELLMLREVGQRHGQSGGLLQMIGTPAEVADQMEEYLDQVGGDGFMLSPIYTGRDRRVRGAGRAGAPEARPLSAGLHGHDTA